MSLSRRTLLRTAAALSGAVAIAGGATVVHWWDQAATPGWRSLSDDERRFLDALADTIFPPGGEPPLGGAESGATKVFDEIVGAMPETQANTLKIFLHSLNASTRPTHFAAFDALSPEERSEALLDWENHPVSAWRTAVQSLKILLGVGYTSHPEVASILSPYFLLGYGR
jgi:hypothetical protein